MVVMVFCVELKVIVSELIDHSPPMGLKPALNTLEAS